MGYLHIEWLSTYPISYYRVGSDPAFIEVMSFPDEESDVPDQYSEFTFQKREFPVIVAGAGFTSTSSQRSRSHRSDQINEAI